MPPKDPLQTPEEVEESRQATLRELSAEWDRKLKCLNDPDAHDKIEAILNARGRSQKRPKAGESF